MGALGGSLGWEPWLLGPLQGAAKFNTNDLNILIYSNTWGMGISPWWSYIESQIYSVRNPTFIYLLSWSSFHIIIHTFFLYLPTHFSPAALYFYRWHPIIPNHMLQVPKTSQSARCLSPHLPLTTFTLYSEYPKDCTKNLCFFLSVKDTPDIHLAICSLFSKLCRFLAFIAGVSIQLCTSGHRLYKSFYVHHVHLESEWELAHISLRL